MSVQWWWKKAAGLGMWFKISEFMTRPRETCFRSHNNSDQGKVWPSGVAVQAEQLSSDPVERYEVTPLSQTALTNHLGRKGAAAVLIHILSKSISLETSTPLKCGVLLWKHFRCFIFSRISIWQSLLCDFCQSLFSLKHQATVINQFILFFSPLRALV